MRQYQEIPLSKHDDDAYKGRMDRLTYSKRMYYIIGQLYEMQEEYIENTSEKEFVNVLIREKNNVISEVIKIIESKAVETVNNAYAFNDEDIYNYHYIDENGSKEELDIEGLLGRYVKHTERNEFICFQQLIYRYIHNNSDKVNNSKIIEFAKQVEELKAYGNASEIFEHIMKDLFASKY